MCKRKEPGSRISRLWKGVVGQPPMTMVFRGSRPDADSRSTLLPEVFRTPVVPVKRQQHAHRLLLEALLVAFVLSFFLPLLWAQSPDLPPGSVRGKVATACLECHESRIIRQQRLGK